MFKYNENLIKAKELIAKNKQKDSTKIEGLPNGQYLTEKFPVLDLGFRPNISKKDWSIKVYGNVSKVIDISYEELINMPYIDINKDFHCVTHWSKKNILWRGVQFKYIASLVNFNTTSKFIIQEGYDSYTTNLPIETMMEESCIIAYSLFGEDIPIAHGGLVRMIIPSRYGWKGSKFLSGIKFNIEDEPGFWELRGYHNNGDYLKEERYS